MRESLIEPQALTFWDRARRLRRNQTEAERRLWAHLRFRQLGNAKFRRQHPVGRFITDFCCMERGLVIELDGGQHAAQVEADQRRSVFLAQQGYRVVRFWDHEVIEDIEAVLQRISPLCIALCALPPLSHENVGQDKPRGRGKRQWREGKE